MPVPKKKKSKAKTRMGRASAWQLHAPGSERLPAVRRGQSCRTPSARRVVGTRTALRSTSIESPAP